MANTPLLQWRPMRPRDIAGICRLADLCYPDLPESAAALAAKQALSPQTCLSLAAPGGDEIAGYMLAHPWLFGDIPPLNQPFTALPPQADCLYLHDLALSPAARGRHYATAAAEELARQALALGLPRLALTAVHNSAPFWQKLGFAPQPLPPRPGGADPLASYGPGAAYMARRL